MYKQSFGLLMCCTLAGLAAEPPQPSVPRPAPMREELPSPRTSVPAIERPRPNLDSLRNNVQQLKSAREALTVERNAAAAVREDSSSVAEIDRLHKELERLLKERRAVRSVPKPVEELPPPRPPVSKADLPVDLLARARALFQAGDVEEALKAYLQIDLAELPEEERAPIQYMIATCCRRLGQLDEAVKWYTVVAKTVGDKELAACAQWQLDGITWTQSFESDIKKMQKQLQGMEKP